MPTEDEVRAALNQVIYPSLGMSLISLGMVRGIRVSAAEIAVDLVMNCPGCPAGEVALAQAYRRLEALRPGGKVTLTLLPEPWIAPWES